MRGRFGASLRFHRLYRLSPSEVPVSPRLRVLLAFAMVYLVWGSTYVAIRLVVEGMPPLLGMGSRFAVAGAVLVAWARVRGEPMPTRLQWRSTAIVGALLFVAGNGGVAWAESQGLASGTAALLVATMPLWMTLLARMHGERTPASALVGLAIGFAGTALLVRPGAGAPLLSLVVALGAGGWALGSLLARRLPLPRAGGMAAGTQMLAGGVMLVVFGSVRGEAWPSLAALSTSSVLAWLYLVVFGSVIAFSAYSFLLRTVAPAKVATYAFVNPVVAVGLGAWVGEPIGLDTVLAMALVSGGVAVTIASRSSRPPRDQPRQNPSTSQRQCAPSQ